MLLNLLFGIIAQNDRILLLLLDRKLLLLLNLFEMVGHVGQFWVKGSFIDFLGLRAGRRISLEMISVIMLVGIDITVEQYSFV